MTILLLSLFTFGILPSIQTFRFSRRFPRTACSVLLRFPGHEAVMHQVTQHLDWQLQTKWYPVANHPPNAPGPILQKPDVSLNNSNLPISLTCRHLNFNASSCTPLSKLMRFECTFGIHANDSWCPCKTEPFRSDSFDAVHCCQVSELITFLENQSDMEPRSLIDDVHIGFVQHLLAE